MDEQRREQRRQQQQDQPGYPEEKRRRIVQMRMRNADTMGKSAPSTHFEMNHKHTNTNKTQRTNRKLESKAPHVGIVVGMARTMVRIGGIQALCDCTH
jgi:hypothetical protein